MNENDKSALVSPVPVGSNAFEGSVSASIASVNSLELLGPRGELKIEHNGEQYSLRRTRHGKLILTK